MPTNSAASPITHIFVLMLENRSFDHMLGFSAITGTDPVTGQSTKITGLTGNESNSANGTPFPVTCPAHIPMPHDPAHQLQDVLEQLCGATAKYSAGQPYPPINSTGFATNYLKQAQSANPAEIMKCYTPSQLPVISALAKEFALCDHWFSSMPGPTWPNRFFVHAASSGGLDHSPTSAEVALWETFSGFQFEHGTIFDALDADGRYDWRIYAGGEFPNVAALKGINNFEVRAFRDFAADVVAPDYQPGYTFIEPNYGDVVFSTFRGGNSQHPMDDVTNGEALIKSVYESLRRSPLWPTSLLIITYDEHGGFYDHVPPPPAVSPGDRTGPGHADQSGFDFTQYGIRVPAIIISPLIPKNTIDHRPYDHASVLATIEALFGLPPLTLRDANANNLTSLASLPSPRTDTPTTLPNPAPSAGTAAMALATPINPASGTDSIDKGNLPGFLHSALRSDLALSPPEDHAAIIAHFKTIKTRNGAQAYLDEVRVKVQAGRAAITQKDHRQSLVRRRTHKKEA